MKDDDFCKEGLIDNYNNIDRAKVRKYWFITYYDKELDSKTKIKEIEEKLCNLPHLNNFVFQVEINKENKNYINIAIGLDDTKSKPVRRFVKLFPNASIYYIKDIKAAREYCSKKNNRIGKTFFHGLTDIEKERLISLGKKERPLKLMQNTKERKIAKMIAKKRNIEETDFDEEEEVNTLIAKVERKEKLNNIDLLNKINKRVKLLLNKIEDKNIIKIIEKIDRDITIVLDKENNNIAKEEKEIIKDTSSKMCKLVKVKNERCETVEKQLKVHKEGIKCLATRKRELEAEKEKVMQTRGFNFTLTQARISEGETLGSIESNIIKRLSNLDGEIDKIKDSISVYQTLISEHPSKVEKAEKTSAISPVSSPTIKSKINIGKASKIISLQSEVNRMKAQHKNYEKKVEENKRLAEINTQYLESITILEENVRKLKVKSKKRPPFQMDFDISYPDKIMATFNVDKEPEDDKWYERNNRAECNILALKHDMDRLILYLNKYEAVISEDAILIS
jgi:hypothetical protein